MTKNQQAALALGVVGVGAVWWTMRRKGSVLEGGAGGSAAAGLDAELAALPVPKPGPKLFDELFRLHGHGLPVAYLRALTRRESSFNPKNVTGEARGLLQVRPVVLRDYNRAHDTSWTHDDMFDPARNIEVAAWLIALIAKTFDQRSGARVPNMRIDWSNPRFVELLTAGWNAGWSRTKGVQRVVDHLVEQGQADITVDHVFAAGKAAGAASTLSRTGKLRFAKLVTRTYFAELQKEPNS